MKDNRTLKINVLSGLIWQFGEKFGLQFVQFFVQIVLARLLAPEDFGTIGIIAVFAALAQVFIQSGFSSALIQKKEISDEECSSIFYVSESISIIIYILLFFASPYIARFYNIPILESLMRIQFLTIIISPITNMQNVILQKTMQFKKSFVRSILTNIISAIVGISFALAGFGVWALVYSNMASAVAGAVILTATVKWMPKKIFSLKKVKNLFKYGSQLLLSSLIDTLYNNIYSLIIGKFFDKAVLGFYNKGKNFPNMAVSTLNGAIQTVIFPALSSCQDNKEQFKNVMRRAIVTSTFLVFPAMIGLSAIAKPLIVIMLTEKWMPSVIFLQLCCASYAFLPVSTANLQAINAVGRSDVFLKLEIIKKIIGVLALVVTIPFGVHVMVASRAVVAGLCMVINAFPSKKLLDYSIREQINDILPSFLLSLFMGVIVWSISLMNINYYIMILLQIIIGTVIYIFSAKLCKIECLEYISEIIKMYISRLRRNAN